MSLLIIALTTIFVGYLTVNFASNLPSNPSYASSINLKSLLLAPRYFSLFKSLYKVGLSGQYSSISEYLLTISIDNLKFEHGLSIFYFTLRNHTLSTTPPSLPSLMIENLL